MLTFASRSKWSASLVACGLALASVVNCSSSTTGGEVAADGGVKDSGHIQPGPVDDAGDAQSQCGSAALPGDRPQAPTCPATALGAGFDAGVVSCTTLADCQDAGAITGPPGKIPLQFTACLAGRCSVDACLTDDDCASGQACGCSATVANANHLLTNACVVAQCRVDADCGKGGICSPSPTSSCGGLSGLYCHSAADTCTTDADCCDATKPSCLYQQTLGHFACQAPLGCNG
jgi:hypothetical protein